MEYYLVVLVTSSFNLKIKCFPKFISSKFTERYEISEKFHELIIKIFFSCPAELSPLNSLFFFVFQYRIFSVWWHAEYFSEKFFINRYFDAESEYNNLFSTNH